MDQIHSMIEDEKVEQIAKWEQRHEQAGWDSECSEEGGIVPTANDGHK